VRLRTKIWLEKEGKAFGDGPWNLLSQVKRLGSLRRAASEIGMSYAQAWNLVKGLEGQLGFRLLQPQVGGKGGGGSHLTSQAQVWVDKYEAFRRECHTFIAESFFRHFGELLGHYEVVGPGERGCSGSGRVSEERPVRAE